MTLADTRKALVIVSGKVYRGKMSQTTSIRICKIHTFITGLLRNFQIPLHPNNLCLAGHAGCFTGIFPESDLTSFEMNISFVMKCSKSKIDPQIPYLFLPLCKHLHRN